MDIGTGECSDEFAALDLEYSQKKTALRMKIVEAAEDLAEELENV